MGKLIYGRREIEIEDRTLAHLKIVMLTKLRRNECFAFNHNYEVESGSGRITLWIHPSLPLEFNFYGNRSAELNREWVESLLMTANSPEGLRAVPEHQQPTSLVVRQRDYYWANVRDVHFPNARPILLERRPGGPWQIDSLATVLGDLLP